MITAGVDMGSKVVKVVILKDGQILSRSSALGGRDKRKSAEGALEEAVKRAGIGRSDLQRITATGAGAKRAAFADGEVTVVGADARGAVWLFPSVRTVIDVGAEEGRGVRCNPSGKAVDFAINERCAAGAGTFTETMARALEMKLEDMGPISLRSEKAVPINAQCAVFAESEVVSLVHSATAKEDIARAVHDAIATRITSMVRQIGVEQDVALIGGLARNPGFVDSLKKDLEVELLIPEGPEYVSALGAALAAAD